MFHIYTYIYIIIQVINISFNYLYIFIIYITIIFTYRGSSKFEEAVECYQRAANMFKMAKNWSSAGSAFYEAAELHAKAGNRHDAATNYVDAANCFKKSNINGIMIVIYISKKIKSINKNINLLFYIFSRGNQLSIKSN